MSRDELYRTLTSDINYTSIKKIITETLMLPTTYNVNELFLGNGIYVKCGIITKPRS